MPIIIDRRENPGKKSLGNRQRFLNRYREQIKQSARKQIGDRSIKDTGDQIVDIKDGISEPKFAHDKDSGHWDYILQGNQDFLPGDTVKKPNN